MRAHYLQHVPFEGLGNIQAWLLNQGYQITSTRFYTDPDLSSALPQPEEIDFLIIMGGPMSVNDEQAYPWLVHEKQFIRKVLEADKPLLGICLGAQLIASVLGVQVLPNPVKEIGWFAIHPPASHDPEVFAFPTEIIAFHWHGETFQLPAGAKRLATNDWCENQAFQLGDKVIGLQCHLETTPESAQALVTHCRDELVVSESVQTEAEILSVPPAQYAAINNLMEAMLAYLLFR